MVGNTNNDDYNGYKRYECANCCIEKSTISMAEDNLEFLPGKIPQMHCIESASVWLSSVGSFAWKFIFDGFNYLSLYLNRPNALQIINPPIKTIRQG